MALVESLQLPLLEVRMDLDLVHGWDNLYLAQQSLQMGRHEVADADSPDLGVRQQFVKLGATRGDLIAITEGVKAGEQVVSSGVFKLRNGAKVMINNTVQPGANPEPKPANT